MLWWSCPARAQPPFSTDDVGVTAKGAVHVEVFNEHDWLQPAQAPHLRQNTVNMRVNYGLTDRVELDVDSPLLVIFNDRTTDPERPVGVGDTDFGVKVQVLPERAGAMALAIATYIEVPTGDRTTGLGSGVVDVWVYGVLQRSFARHFVARLNGGYLFAGNTSTGVVGLTTTHGHVATMSGSLVKAVTDTASVGIEVAAAVASDVVSDRAQLQTMIGGSYTLRDGLALNVGVLAGRFTASPRVGFQIGLSWDVSHGLPHDPTR